jgi:hypothetical protein
MRITFCLAVASLLGTAASAQDWSGKTYKFDDIYPGYIVSQKGDTTTGYVLHGGRAYNQGRCVFFEDATRKSRREFKPSELKAYGVADKHYRSMHFSGGLLAKPMSFVLVSRPGAITMFTYYSKNNDNLLQVRGGNESLADFDARIHGDEIVWQKGGEEPLQQQDLVLGFAKKVSKLVSDYPELSAKVAAKEKGYGLAGIYNIMEEYNRWAESRK